VSSQVGATGASPRLGAFEGRFRACFAGLAERVAASGAAYSPAGVCPSQRARLLDEASGRVLRSAPTQVGAVRQRAELAVFGLAAAGAATRAAAAELQQLVASRAGRFGGQGFEVNELTLMRYRGRGAGISAHRDHARYRLLIAVLSLQGHARLAIVADRAASRPLASWHCRPGDVVLLRAPGWADCADGRPLHLVDCDPGERLTLSLRMDSRLEVDAPVVAASGRSPRS
jgi:hypothetical protein